MNVYILLQEERHGGVGPLGVFYTRPQADTFIEKYCADFEQLDNNTFGSEESIIHVFEMSVHGDE